jgi:putative transcriptional regulator
VGEKILGSIRHARAVLRGEAEGEFVVHVPDEFDVKALRGQLGMSQARFAATSGFGLDAVKSWEQDRGRPRNPPAHCSRLFERCPDAVRRALAA